MWPTFFVGGADRTIGCRVVGSQAITTTTDTIINFTALATEGGVGSNYPGMWSLAGPSRVFAPRTGWYVAAAVFDWPDNASTDHRSLAIRKNGTAFAVQNRNGADTTTHPSNYSTAGLVYLEAGDYVDCAVLKSLAGTVTPQTSTLAVCFIAPSTTDGVWLTRSTTQAVATSTDTAVSFSSALTQTGATLWTAGDTVTIPSGADGWYLFSGAVGWATTSAAGGRRLWIEVDGVQTSRMSAVGQTTDILHLGCCGAAYLSAGSTVKLVVRQNAGSSQDIVSGARLMVVRVPAISAAASLTRTSTLAGASQQFNIPWETEVKDDGALWSSSDSDDLRLPTHGMYLVCAYSHWAAQTGGSHRVLDIVLNDLPGYRGYNSVGAPAAHNDPTTGCWYLGYFNAGGTIKVICNRASSTASIQAAKVQIMRMPRVRGA